MLRCLALLVCLWGFAARATTSTDLALVLAIDASYSVDELEFEQQFEGTAAAFRSPEVLRAIEALPTQRIAVSIIQWSRYDSQVISLPWRIVDGPAGALALSGEISGSRRQTREGGTSISGALSYALLQMARCPCLPERRVIDVSGDGRHNSGPSLALVRSEAAARGVTINGLAILNEVRTLHYYFERHLITGVNAFVEAAADYSDYARAIKRKLLRELTAGFVGLPHDRHLAALGAGRRHSQ